MKSALAEGLRRFVEKASRVAGIAEPLRKMRWTSGGRGQERVVVAAAVVVVAALRERRRGGGGGTSASLRA